MNHNNKAKRTFALPIKSTLLSLSLICLNINAQQFEDAASIEVGDFDFTPTIDLGLHFDDNLTKTTNNQLDSWSLLVSPQLNMQTSFGLSQFSFAYRLRNEQFFSSPEDDYTDHFIIADLDVEFDARNRVKAFVEFEDGHEERGSSFSIGIGDQLSSPDKYKQTEFDLVYSYGAFNADGRLEMNVNILDLNYDINTPRYLARDRQLTSVGGTFLYRIGPTTDLSLDLRQRNIDYKFDRDPNNTLDSTVRQYLVGVQWEATAKTSGFVKVGYEERDFDSNLRIDFDGFDWSAGVLWEPTEYASFELITGADTDETNGEGNFIRGKTHSVEWRHEWMERLRSSARLTFNENRYEGELIDEFGIRVDDNFAFQGSVFYQFRRWLNFELTYRYSERDSNRSLIDFDRNQLMFNLLVTL